MSSYSLWPQLIGLVVLVINSRHGGARKAVTFSLLYLDAVPGPSFENTECSRECWKNSVVCVSAAGFVPVSNLCKSIYCCEISIYMNPAKSTVCFSILLHALYLRYIAFPVSSVSRSVICIFCHYRLTEFSEFFRNLC